ncbi:MAG: hypothetical protein QNJ97_27005 [Myxococcota bacterium]|nr:hypothetical protein [Myxococcota bacterium]
MRDSLFVVAGVYTVLGNGVLVYCGDRPGVDWHGHGYFPKTLTMMAEGKPVKVLLLKHRWKDTITGRTVHDRPPDDPIFIRFCSLIVFLRVWAAISSVKGFHNRKEVFECLETGCGSDRTVQRWTHRALQNGMAIQQAIRLSLIEEVEPRPIERLFDGGLSPPHVVTEKRWKSSQNLSFLYRGYAMLLVAAKALAIHASYLLAGARRRWPESEKTFGF